MAVLSGAPLSGEAAKTRAKFARTRGEAARKISFKVLLARLSFRAHNQNRHATQASVLLTYAFRSKFVNKTLLYPDLHVAVWIALGKVKANSMLFSCY